MRERFDNSTTALTVIDGTGRHENGDTCPGESRDGL